MGRGVARPRPPAELMATLFYLGNDCELHHARREGDSHFNSCFAGKPAGFDCAGRRVVRFDYRGRTRRIAVERVKRALLTRRWPKGA
jgi:hypothetical protein